MHFPFGRGGFCEAYLYLLLKTDTITFAYRGNGYPKQAEGAYFLWLEYLAYAQRRYTTR